MTKTMLTHLAAAAALAMAGGQALAQGASERATAPGSSMNAPSPHGSKAPSDTPSAPSDKAPSPSTTSPSTTSPSTMDSPSSTSEIPKAGRVAVDVSALRSDLAQELNIDEDEVPATVMLPPGQAAQACGKSASELAPTTGSAMATCSAETATSDLRDAVKSELGGTTKPGQ